MNTYRVTLNNGTYNDFEGDYGRNVIMSHPEVVRMGMMVRTLGLHVVSVALIEENDGLDATDALIECAIGIYDAIAEVSP